MKINEYIWSMFDIARENDVDIGVGRDIFIANLEQSKSAYHGKDGLDYAALDAAWDKLTLEEKARQKAPSLHSPKSVLAARLPPNGWHRFTCVSVLGLTVM